MDDRRLESLLRMALEADDLERSAAQPSLKLVHAGAPRRTWLLPLAAAMTAAAASLAIVTLVLPSLNPPVQPSGLANAHVPTHKQLPVVPGDFDTPLAPVRPVASSEDEASVVLAFFEGIDGRCTCLHIQDQEWDIDELAAKGRGELLDVAYRSQCGSPSPSLLVVAIAGKRDSLPRSPEQAEALASRLSDHTRVARSELVNRAYLAVPGLPAGSMVVAETVGNRSAMVDFAKYSSR